LSRKGAHGGTKADRQRRDSSVLHRGPGGHAQLSLTERPGGGTPRTVGIDKLRSLHLTLGLTIMYVEADERQVDFMSSKRSLRGKILSIRDAAQPRGGPECLRGVFPQDFPSRSLVIFKSKLSQDKASEPYLPWGGLQRQPRHNRDRARAVGAGVRDSSCTCVPVRTNTRITITMRPKCAILFVGSYANLRELVSQTIGYSYKPHEALQ
jgi:hypothetical protein